MEPIVIVEGVLLALASYAALGVLFALPFVTVGVGRLDADAREGSRGFRILIFPGVVAFWPLLLARWLRGAGAPEERNAHRCAAPRSPAGGASEEGRP